MQDKPTPLLKTQVTDEGQEGLVNLLLIALLPTELSQSRALRTTPGKSSSQGSY